MILETNPADLDTWQKQMHTYEKSKRTKKPFGENIPKVQIINHQLKKLQENRFNPVLQTFKHKQDEQQVMNQQENRRTQSMITRLKFTNKYEKPYDIVNLYPPKQTNDEEKKRKNQVPLRYDFNIVSNQPLNDAILKNSKLVLTEKPPKQNMKEDIRDYNIITNDFKNNNESRRKSQSQYQKQNAEQKYWKTHDFNPIVNTYYDEKRQAQYQEQLQKQMKEHGKDYIHKFPPSYVYRQKFELDPTKQPSLEVKNIEEKIKNQKKRFQLKYKIEKQYAERNIEHDLKQQAIIKKKIHEFRPENTKQYLLYASQYNALEHKPSIDTTVKITNTDPKSQSFVIKTGGFN